MPAMLVLLCLRGCRGSSRKAEHSNVTGTGSLQGEQHALAPAVDAALEFAIASGRSLTAAASNSKLIPGKVEADQR